MLGEAHTSNKVDLERRMVRRHEQSVLRKRAKVDGGQDEASESSGEAGEGGEGESEPEEEAARKLQQDPDDEDAENRRVEIEREPRPVAGVEGDEGTREQDWARAGVAERLSAAGAAPAAPDRLHGTVRGDAASAGGMGPVYMLHA